MTKSFISAETITKSFGDTLALDGVDLDIAEGETVVLTGVSGSGKTTLLNLMAGLDRPDSGRLRVDGFEVSAAPESRRAAWRGKMVGYAFQRRSLPMGTRALDAVATPLLWVEGLSPRAARDRAMERLEALGIGDLAARKIGGLSGGQSQRVMIARALVTRPRLILADEPTAQLDPKTGHEIVEALRESAAEMGATLVVVTHERPEDWSGARHLQLVDGAVRENIAT